MIGPIILVKYISVSDLYASQGETVADLFLSKSAVNNCKDPILFSQRDGPACERCTPESGKHF